MTRLGCLLHIAATPPPPPTHKLPHSSSYPPLLEATPLLSRATSPPHHVLGIQYNLGMQILDKRYPSNYQEIIVYLRTTFFKHPSN